MLPSFLTASDFEVRPEFFILAKAMLDLNTMKVIAKDQGQIAAQGIEVAKMDLDLEIESCGRDRQ